MTAYQDLFIYYNFFHFLYANIHKWSTSISKNCFTDFRPSSLIQTQSLKKQRRGKSKKQY